MNDIFEARARVRLPRFSRHLVAALSVLALAAALPAGAGAVATPGAGAALPVGADAASPPVIPGSGSPPQNIAAPGITGPLETGATVQADPGAWQGAASADAFGYQWYLCAGASGCQSVASATGSSFTIPQSAVASELMVAVTATGPGGTTTLDSPVSGAITDADGTPTVTRPPTILGSATVGSTLAASPDTFSGTPPLSYSYQWWACADGCQPIFGAQGPTLRVTAADIGRSLVYTVTASNRAGSQAAAPSMTRVVAAPPAILHTWLTPLVTLTGAPGHLSAIRAAGGYLANFNAAVVGHATVTWTAVVGHGARARRVTVASGAGAIAFTAPRTKIRITLTPAGAALLRRVNRLALTSTARFVYAFDTRTQTAQLSRSVTLSS